MKKGAVILFLLIFLAGFTLAEEGSLGNDAVVSNQNYISAANNANEESISQKNFFCGKSTKGACEEDEDCIVGGCSNSVCQAKSEEPAITTCIYSECQNAENYHTKCVCIDKKCKWNRPNMEEIKNLTRKENKLRVENKTEKECPRNCTCTGSAIKCELKGGREMTVIAGNSGNVIIQVKGENMTTNVTLYKNEDGKFYLITKNNETRQIRMLPDQVRERLREKIRVRFNDENLTLNENGSYNYQAQKEARLFLLFPVKVKVDAEIDGETGNITKVKVPWWSFFAKDKEEEPIMGASCGTVTPGYNDECCQTKGYDVWNSGTSECEFSD